MRTLLAFVFAFLFAAAPAAAANSFVVDPARTSIAFAIDAHGFPTTHGTFRRFDGKLSVDFDRPAASAVNFRVEAASLDTGSASLDDYIRSSVFLDAAKYPEITFASTDVVKLDAQTVRVTGNMTLLGVTKPATFTVTVERTGGRLGFVAKGDVARSAFGMISGQPLISDDIAITVSTEVGS